MRKGNAKKTTPRLLAGLVLLALPATSLLAQEKPAAQAPRDNESFATVNKEFRKDRDAYVAELRAAYEEARKNGKEKDFKFDKPDPSVIFSPRFLAIAEKDPEGADAVAALKMTLQTGYGPKGEPPETRGKALKILRGYQVVKPEIKGLLKLLVGLEDDEAQKLIDEVIARNPDRRVQAAAYKDMVAHCEMLVNSSESFKSDPKLRASWKAAWVAQRIAKGEKAKAELEGLKSTLRTRYGDLLADVSIGVLAPRSRSGRSTTRKSGCRLSEAR